MTTNTILFLALQILASIVGVMLAYSHCYFQRLQGVSGQKLEGMLVQWGFICSFILSILFFWSWPEGASSWSKMPMFKWICQASLINPPESDPGFMSMKAVISLIVGFFFALLARLNAFSLTRRLVRKIPRYYRPEPPVGKP